MKKIFIKVPVVILAFALLFLTGCGTSPSQGTSTKTEVKVEVKDVTVGVLYPTSGDAAILGQAALNAVKLAADDINAAGGIKSLGGAKIKLDIVDPGSNTESTRSATENILKDSPTAITGNYLSGLSMVTSEVAERAKVPFVTASVSDALSSRGYKYFFQVSPKSSMFGATQIEFAKKVLVDEKGMAPKAAIIFENTSYGQSTSKGLVDAAKKMGFDIVLNESYDANFTDANPLVTKIKASGATILFPVSYLQDAILIQKSIKQQNVKIFTVGGGAGYLMGDFYKALGKDAEGVISVASWNNDVNKPGVDDIAKRYQAKFGSFLTEHSGEAYSATWAIAHAIDLAKSADPQKVRDALSTLKMTAGYPGDIMPGGQMEFDSTGWNKNVHPVMIQWQDGLPRTIYPIADSKAKIKLDF